MTKRSFNKNIYDLNGGSKKKKKRKTKKINKRKTKKISKRKTKKINQQKNKTCIFYFSMKGCPYCDSFSSTWKTINKKYPRIDMFNIEREKEPTLIKELDITSFPTIKLLNGNSIIDYEYERSLNIFDTFLRENKII